MGEHTAISWCDHTFNPWIGCSKVSDACAGCYAEVLMDTRHKRVKWGGPGKGAGTRVRTSAGNWNEPRRWDRKAAAAGTRPFVFCASLADIFDNEVPAEWRRDVFALMRATPHLIYLLLTKRPQNIIKLSEAAGGLPANAALGTTIEDQIRADQNVPHLYAASIRLAPLFTFVSIEPILGEVNLRSIAVTPGRFDFLPRGHDRFDALQGLGRIGWVITGGETDQGDHKARPWHPNWVRRLRDDCAATDTPFHHKQNGELCSYDLVGANGWRLTREAEGKRFGTLFRGDFGDVVEEPLFDGASFETTYPWGNASTASGSGPCIVRVGKKRSGRLLDGVEHNARPHVRPIASAA